MDRYWVGVLAGFFISVVLLIMSIMIMIDRDRSWQIKVDDLNKQVQQLSDIVEEDRKIMQTYKFFNESWQAIIDMRKEQKDVGTN